MPPCSGLAGLNKPCTKVMQWSGEQTKAVRRVSVPLAAATDLALRRGTGFPSQKPCCGSRTWSVFTFSHSIHTILRPWLSPWWIAWRSFIVTRMVSVDSVPVNVQRRFQKAWEMTLLWQNRRNGRVTPLRTIFLWPLTILVLLWIERSSSEKLQNIVSTNHISTLSRCISWPPSLTICASFATLSMWTLNSHK